jgi:hypothetical protein
MEFGITPLRSGLGGNLQHVGDVDVLLVPRIGIRRAPRRGLPASPAHPHPPVPDDPENVRLVPIVEDCAKYPLSEGGSYRLAPVTDIFTM